MSETILDGLRFVLQNARLQTGFNPSVGYLEAAIKHIEEMDAKVTDLERFASEQAEFKALRYAQAQR